MLRRQSFLVGGVLLAALSGCASSSSVEVNPNERVGDIRSNDVWKTGTQLTGVVRIYEGATVEIEPGAHITCTDATQIIVGGTLRVQGGTAHASITCPSWSGFLVATNGSLDITGLDIENASTGYETQTGAGSVNLTDSRITSSTRPFTVRAGSTLTVTHVTATTPAAVQGNYNVSVSEIYGTFNAHYLSYDASSNEGIMTMRDGTTDIEDSTLQGAQNGFDLVSAYGAKSVTVKYTTMTGAHCGNHIDASKDADHVPTKSFLFDHVTADSNQFGITIYATSTDGTLVVKDSNFIGLNSWIDIEGDHGVITFQNVFTSGRALVMNTDPPTFGTTPTRIADAKPR